VSGQLFDFSFLPLKSVTHAIIIFNGVREGFAVQLKKKKQCAACVVAQKL